MPTVATASPITFTTLPQVTIRPRTATTHATAGRIFNPVHGHRISDPLYLPGDPVTASVMRWETYEPPGTTVAILTSINYGASWDVASNNQPVPRLREGDTDTPAVMTRVVMTRASETDPKPALKYLELIVTCDSGVYEWVPVGYGTIDKPKARSSVTSPGGGNSGGAGVTARGGGQHGGGQSVTISCTDSSARIRDAGWEQPYTIYAGTNVADAVKAMILNRKPGHDRFRMVSTSRRTPSQITYGLDGGNGDAWKDISEFAGSYGYEIFFDPNDVLVFQSVADPRTAVPVLVIDQAANPVITEAESELDLTTVVNYVVCHAQGALSKNPLTAFAFDNDPQSLTYVGRIGRRVKHFNFPNLDTIEDLQAACNAILYNSLGATNTVTLTMMAHSCLEPGDAVQLAVPDVNAAGIYVIQRILPMPVSSNGLMRLEVYKQTSNTTTSIVTG